MPFFSYIYLFPPAACICLCSTYFFKKGSGSHLLSHAVPSTVPSAARALTLVFGVGTRVPPGRIAASSSLFQAPWHLDSNPTPTSPRPRKEVIQPHLPVRLPCYDFTPVTRPAFGCPAPLRGSATDFGHSWLPWCDGRCVQDPGTYSPRHSDPRLLAIPASCSRVADCNPNWDVIFEFRLRSLSRFPLFTPL